MRAWLDAMVQRLFPGMGLRPFYMTVVATWAMVFYHHHGSPGGAPPWFVDTARAWIGVEDATFHQYLWSHLCAVVMLMLIPIAICRWLEGWTLAQLGLGVRHAHRELFVVIALWAAMIPLVWLVHDTDSFAATYPRYRPAERSMELFFLYEGFYLVKWMAWEFFFRGFMLFGFGKDMLQRSVLVSTIPFTLMHYGKPELEMVSALVAGFVLCFIALRGRSIWPGVLLHWLVAGTMDFFASEWWR